MPTDTSEKGLETLIVASLVEEAGYQAGSPNDYDREHAVDTAKLMAFPDRNAAGYHPQGEQARHSL